MMKRNIDLTENQMFSQRTFFEQRVVKLASGTELPWSFPWARVEIERFEAIRTENKQERWYKKLYDEEISRNYCDRCGAYLISIPWNRTYGLCHQCHDELGRESETILTYPWGEK